MIFECICKLVNYALNTELINEEDTVYVVNTLLDVLNLDEFMEIQLIQPMLPDELETVLAQILSYAISKGIIEDNISQRDLFDTRLMGVFLPPPSQVINKFYNYLNKYLPEDATNYFYKLCQDSNYIRRYRIIKDYHWRAQTEYGELYLSINLSKPEKDPVAIAAEKLSKQSGYPKCLLCIENEGYRGRINYPARQNLRIIPITINGEEWGFQYSPYVYYPEHCIVINAKHIPMKIARSTFVKLFDFINLFPHYFVGSNADLPIVGGSILTHDHFQGGRYEFPMEKAPIERYIYFKEYKEVKVGIVKWPMSVIRISGKDIEQIISLADKLLHEWREYTDESVFIYAYTNEEPHNTITPIARKRGENYELDLVLRNNITTKKYPLGVYHPHEELHHIKKENIGLIEVMGLAILPPRLNTEMDILAEALVSPRKVNSDEIIAKHLDWINEINSKYSEITSDNVKDVIEKEIGIIFEKVLTHSGVFKRNEEGQAAFIRFLQKTGGSIYG